MNANPFEVLEKRIDKRLDRIEAGIMQLAAPQTLPEKYLTTDQVCELLSVSRVTLWSWDRKGILESCRIGNQKRYKLSDIEKIMNNR